jgi:hypothetical protein
MLTIHLRKHLPGAGFYFQYRKWRGKAREAFLKYDARRAADLLERPALSKALSEANLAQLANALTQAVYQLPWLEAEKLRKDPGGETAQLLYEALDALKGVLHSGN